MAETAPKMICPRCGVEMNHHSDKLVYPSDAAEADPALGSLVEEFHTCPKCGGVASRHA
jgi:ribosomal protein S27AE